MGRGMVIAAWILFLILLAWLFQGFLENQYNPNPSPVTVTDNTGLRQVELKRNRSGHYVTAGTINGQRVRFLVDTGATDVALSDIMARRLGLKPGAPVILSTANGRVRGYKSSIDRISVGAIELNHIPAVISPGMGAEDVLLGMSFLKHLELIQKDRTLTLRAPQA